MSIQYKINYVDWFQKFDWSLFGTLTFRPGIGRKAAVRLFREWIAIIELNEGKNLSWVWVGEYGPENLKFHFHILIAGIERTSVTWAEELWRRKVGRAVIGLYDQERRGLQYALKSLEVGRDDFDFMTRDEHLLAAHRSPEQPNIHRRADIPKYDASEQTSNNDKISKGKGRGR